jgi:hypothetical protein
MMRTGGALAVVVPRKPRRRHPSRPGYRRRVCVTRLMSSIPSGAVAGPVSAVRCRRLSVSHQLEEPLARCTRVQPAALDLMPHALVVLDSTYRRFWRGCKRLVDCRYVRLSAVEVGANDSLRGTFQASAPGSTSEARDAL